MPKQRILYLDIVKIVAMWLVCTGHVYTFVDTGIGTLREWIYSFHMPLFMMLSGYFSVHAFNKPFKEFILGKSKHLLLPAITVPVICIILFKISGRELFTLVVKDQMIGGMWFLKTLFACYLTLYILKRTPFADAWLCLVSIFVSALIPYGDTLQFNWMLMFFWTGYFLRKYYHIYEKHYSLITIFSLFFFLFLGNHHTPETITINLLVHKPLYLPLQYLTGLAGSMVILGGVKAITIRCHGEIMHKIGNLGTYTLGIYALQHILFYAVLSQIFNIKTSGILSVLIEYIGEPVIGLLCVIVCYLLIQWLRRYKVMNFLLFGGQY